MRKLILISMIMISPFASTGTLKYRIQMNLSRGGEVVSTGTFLARNGEAVEISQGNTNTNHIIEVTAIETTFNGESMIHLKLKVEGVEKNGERVVIAEPEILAHENQMAELVVGSQEKQNDLQVNIIAERTL
ncbi:MAG: hypothetical protein RJB66_2458 [Pseudomonadota bacterium]|jgi:type II secretory pathway component GspD/PulD (secretin)